MLIVYFTSGQGGAWSVGPLIALAPLLLHLAPYLYNEITVPSISFGFGSSTLLQLFSSVVLNFLIPAIGFFSIVRFVRWVRQNGGWTCLLRLLLQGYQGGPAFPTAGAQRPGGMGRPQQRQQRRVTLEEVAEALSKLPTEPYMTSEQLAALPVHDLKALIHGRGLDPDKCLEKGELVRQLLEHGGSSADSCSICCEDYVTCQGSAGPVNAGAAAQVEPEADADDAQVVLRVLRCGHRFHVECVDKWFLSATDYTREPACPLCNAPLLLEQQGSRGPQRRR